MVTITTLSVHNRNRPRLCYCTFNKYRSFTRQRSKTYRRSLRHSLYYDSNWDLKGIALIGSIFFGIIGTGSNIATTHIDTHSNGSINHARIHYYNDALVSSMLFIICLVITTLFLVFLLPSRRHEKNQRLYKLLGSHKKIEWLAASRRR